MKYTRFDFPWHRARGFTLVELMIVVAVVGILAGLAYPSYRDYMIRGKLVDATSGLNSMRAEMERYFQDHRTFLTIDPNQARLTAPCERAVGLRTFGEFTVSCVPGANTFTTTRYTVRAVGSRSTANFEFRVDQDNLQTTLTTEPGWTPANPNTCWVVKRGQTC